MKYRIDKASKTPAYEQLYRLLRADIAEGVLPPRYKLPSKRFLAAELEIAVITVEHAYELLCDEGYAVSRPRSGYYVAYGAEGLTAGAPRATQAQMSAHNIGADEDFPFSVLAKTMRRVLSRCDRGILVKSPNRGTDELRRAIADYLLRSRGISAAPERIVIGSGAEYLYGLIAQLFERGSTFAVENPCYEKIPRVYEANGIACIPLKMGSDGISSSALSECRASALHVTPFHSYPSGITAAAAKRAEYIDWARRGGAFIVEDDYASEFAVAGRQIDTMFSLAPDIVVYVNTFTKTIAPAMRMGYMLLPESLDTLFSQKLDFYSCTVPVFEQYVLAEFINNGDLERSINRRRRRLRRDRQLFSTEDRPD